jgi:hypothetical protein
VKCPVCGETIDGGAPICPGCGRPLLLPISSRKVALTDQTGRQFPLPSGVSRVGRDPASNEIVLMDHSVSSRHAAIEVSSRAIILRDLGSTNGTRINGSLTSQAVILQTGDVIVFGDRQFTLTPVESPHPRAPRGIPILISPARRQVDESIAASHLPAALATIALVLLATMLHGVGLADGIERDVLPLPLAAMLALLIALPLLGIALIAASRRSGYLVAAASGLAGLLVIVLSGPVPGGVERSAITDQYGAAGFWFVAGAAVIALVVEVLVLTVSVAGWRMQHPSTAESSPAPTG